MRAGPRIDRAVFFFRRQFVAFDTERCGLVPDRDRCASGVAGGKFLAARGFPAADVRRCSVRRWRAPAATSTGITTLSWVNGASGWVELVVLQLDFFARGFFDRAFQLARRFATVVGFQFAFDL